MTYNVIIIGSGPAGLTAGIYTGRSKLKPLLIEGLNPGGQLMTTGKVENWPGDISINGFELMQRMREHTKQCDCELLSDKVTDVDVTQKPFTITTQSGKTFQTKSIIITTGATHGKLNIPGEKEYWGKGVSVCAVCDAPFYQDKEIVIVGGGNSAVAEARELARFAKRVTIVNTKNELTATDPIKYEILENKKISILNNTTITEIKGDNNSVTGITIKNLKENNITEIPANGVFVAIGLSPNSTLFTNKIEIDERGFIVKKQNSQTSVEGIFVAGDVSDSRYRQAITAAGEGCMAALDCENYLSTKK
jgi:thioredoxin reductase (NADPH)